LQRSPGDTWLYRFAYTFLPFLWRLFYRMEIHGVENVPTSGPVVLACNHRSNLDPFFLGVSCPRQIHFMAKRELWRFWLLGKLIDWLGAFSVTRGGADRQAVRKALAVLDSQAVLGLFPEGHRYREGRLGEISPGVTLFSLREGVATVPVYMQGTDKACRLAGLRWPKVRVAFGPPLQVPPAELPRPERAALVKERLEHALLSLDETLTPGQAVASLDAKEGL